MKQYIINSLQRLTNYSKQIDAEAVLYNKPWWIVRDEGKRKVNREIQFYNLDVIISTGYHVNSVKTTQFRKFIH
jgi:hypothetical protein